MTVSVKLSDELVNEARVYKNVYHRSIPGQIEYWAKIGRIAIDNPDLPISFIEGLLVGLEESKHGKSSEYVFGLGDDASN